MGENSLCFLFVLRYWGLFWDIISWPSGGSGSARSLAVQEELASSRVGLFLIALRSTLSWNCVAREMREKHGKVHSRKTTCLIKSAIYPPTNSEWKQATTFVIEICFPASLLRFSVPITGGGGSARHNLHRNLVAMILSCSFILLYNLLAFYSLSLMFSMAH